MALKEKKVLREVTICDMCEQDIPENETTHLKAHADGYMKRENFEVDLCMDCAGKIGLRRRGRRPASKSSSTVVSTITQGKRSRGRPRKVQQEESQTLAANA